MNITQHFHQIPLIQLLHITLVMLRHIKNIEISVRYRYIVRYRPWKYCHNNHLRKNVNGIIHIQQNCFFLYKLAQQFGCFRLNVIFLIY